MPVDTRDLIEEGLDRTFDRNGLVFIGVFTILIVLVSVLWADLLAGLSQQLSMGVLDEMASNMGGALFGLPVVVAAVGILVLSIIHLVATITAVRTFFSQQTATIPDAFYTHKIPFAVGNLMVGGIIFGAVVSLGLVLFIIPGIFILVSLFFWNISVMVEDNTFMEGFSRSWAVTEPNRRELFVLGLVVTVITTGLTLLPALATGVLPRIAHLLFGGFITGVATVFTTATAARTYRSLTWTSE